MDPHILYKYVYHNGTATVITITVIELSIKQRIVCADIDQNIGHTHIQYFSKSSYDATAVCKSCLQIARCGTIYIS